MRRSRIVVPALLLAAAVAGAGCGGDDDDGGRSVTATSGRVTVETRDIAFDITRIEAPVGPLEITLEQHGAIQHTLVIDEASDFKLVVNGQSTDSGTVEMEAGEYEYYCDIPGHRGQGMKGTLVVE